MPGISACGMFTISRKTSFCMTALASLSWSAGVDRVVASRPLGSVYVEFVIPRSSAAAFIFLTNAFSVSASQRASSRATLLPDGIIRSWSI